MFNVIKNGKVIDSIENPVFVSYDSKNNCYVLADEQTADGVNINGTIYSLYGRTRIVNSEFVQLVRIDASEMFKNLNSMQADTDALSVEHEYELTLLKLGVE